MNPVQAMDLLSEIGVCVERGKVSRISPYPPELQDRDGADELARKAIERGIAPDEILSACSQGMERIGERFGRNEVFVPELLMAAKAMSSVMEHLRPFFESGSVKTKGTFVLGTVHGDLHDIGKNLVGMVVSGAGWEVVDLGVDVKPLKFVDVVQQHPDCIVGLSALLTTTMANMAKTVELIKTELPGTTVVVGGAPLNSRHARDMGADGYAPDPQAAVTLLSGVGI